MQVQQNAVASTDGFVVFDDLIAVNYSYYKAVNTIVASYTFFDAVTKKSFIKVQNSAYNKTRAGTWDFTLRITWEMNQALINYSFIMQDLCIGMLTIPALITSYTLQIGLASDLNLNVAPNTSTLGWCPYTIQFTTSKDTVPGVYPAVQATDSIEKSFNINSGVVNLNVLCLAYQPTNEGSYAITINYSQDTIIVGQLILTVVLLDACKVNDYMLNLNPQVNLNLNLGS